MLRTFPNPPSTYIGWVDGTGEMLAGPAGWSAERTEDGRFIIRHDLDTEHYVVHATALISDTQDGAFASVNEVKAEYFTVKQFNHDGGLAHHWFMFTVTVA